jgi:hypothetical protein
MKGHLEVNAFANMLTEQFGGSLSISKAQTELPGGESHEVKKGNGYGSWHSEH